MVWSIVWSFFGYELLENIFCVRLVGQHSCRRGLIENITRCVVVNHKIELRGMLTQFQDLFRNRLTLTEPKRNLYSTFSKLSTKTASQQRNCDSAVASRYCALLVKELMSFYTQFGETSVIFLLYAWFGSVEVKVDKKLFNLGGPLKNMSRYMGSNYLNYSHWS